MEHKKVSTLFEEMKDDISNYVTGTIELTKLQAYEKLSKGASVIAVSLIVVYLALIAFAIILVTIGLYLGDLLGSMWQGFGIMALVTILIVLILLLARKAIKKFITNTIIFSLMSQENKQSSENKSTEAIEQHGKA